MSLFFMGMSCFFFLFGFVMCTNCSGFFSSGLFVVLVSFIFVFPSLFLMRFRLCFPLFSLLFFDVGFFLALFSLY
jgi:hypothetical protein